MKGLVMKLVAWKSCSFRKKGFTLVELLVVISIIALLVSILMPALSKAREQAKLTVCITYVRQIVLAETYYALDHEDWLPPGNFAQMYAEIRGLPFPGGYIVWRDALDEYIDDAQGGLKNYRMTCPNFTKVHPSIQPWGINGSPYGQNGYMDINKNGVVDPKVDLYAAKSIRMTKIKSPSEFLLISESYWNPSFPYSTAWMLGGPSNPTFWQQYPENRHKGKFPIGFADGHAAAYGAKEHPNSRSPGMGEPDPILWPNIPDNWWMMR